MSYVLPIKNDKVRIRSGDELTIEAYTRLGTGPELYVQVGEDEEARTIEFSEITHINGVPVSLDRAANVFIGLGTIKRRNTLPGVDDVITDENGVDHKITTLRLQKKRYGEMKGLFFISKDGVAVNLKNVRAVVYADTGYKLDNAAALVKYYADYLPVKKQDDGRDSRKDAI